ncbi:helix-turn-helix transcriptional regulator [Pseudonocardia asaccharolytica]|uniref:helix-turn-helix transcriptional regulator n=1 Tax=Pseudonocardia asaccharolytica TaxID=54010 RepID=UPI0004111D8A|nr:LuxR C-terminal-related transcriptional regulator [Pseudonocardia asaccharolytica]
MRTSQITAIAEIGSIVAGAVRGADDPGSVLAPLRRIASFDAAMIAVRDPLTGRHRPLANEGYAPSLLTFLNSGYLSCYSYDVARTCRRPMRMRDFGPDFYRTPVYREFLDGAGYREGVTLVLRSGGDRGCVTGLMTMSFTEPRAADQAARRGLELVAPTLGQLVDTGRTPTLLASLIGGGAAAYIVDGTGTTFATSGAGEQASEEPSVAAIAVTRAFLSSDSPSLRGYCARRCDAVWERAHLVRLSDNECADGPRALLMLRHEPLPCALTERELDVLTLVSRGLPNRAIGASLGISPRTTGRHIEHLLLKTSLANRAALASYAVENGLIRLGL